jgi:class 3 adenylate cyclase
MESSSRTLVCSVLFLDIVEYSRKPVAEQLLLKQAFNRVLTKSLDEVPQRDRIILDTGDGAAVTFMGDPEDALFAAMTVRDTSLDVPVRLGVNLGPVRLVRDLNGQMNIIGDGINVAQRVMSFSRPGQLLVSRSFYEVVSCLSRDYVNLFRHEGSRTDKHVREHEVYSVIGPASARRLSDTGPRPIAANGQRAWLSRLASVASLAWLAGTGPYGLRRSALLAAPLLFFALVLTGFAARAMMGTEAERVPPAPRVSFAPRPQTVFALAVESEPAAGLQKKSDEKTDKAAVKNPGRIELAVTPWGEVVLDGRSRGVSPPLRTLELAPGQHTVEIRNSTFPSRVERVEVKSGEAITIRHRFRR